MPLKVLFDACAIGNLAKLDPERRLQLKSAINRRQFDSYVSIDTVEELACTPQVPGKPDPLIELGGVVVDLIRFTKLVNTAMVTVHEEVAGLTRVSPLAGNKTDARFRRWVKSWCSSQVRSPTFEAEVSQIKAEKEQWESGMASMRKTMLAIPGIKKQPKVHSIEDMRRLEGWDQIERNVVKQLLGISGRPGSDAECAELVKQREKLPYFSALLGSVEGRFFHNMLDPAQGMPGFRTGSGDFYDTKLMIHMAYTDVLVTDDWRVAKALLPCIFGVGKAAIDSRAFIDTVRAGPHDTPLRVGQIA